MISNNLLQAEIITKLKADTPLTDKLTEINADSGSGDIKEDQYTGRDFDFPAVRVELLTQTPMDNEEPCDNSRLTFNVRIYAEGMSSQNADILAGLVDSALNKKQIDAITFSIPRIRSDGLVPAFRLTERLWMAYAIFTANVYGKS